MRTLATYLRGLDPHLPRTVWLVQAGGVVNALGNGIVFPFAIIYLHNVRGISFAQAGFALAIGGASALAAGLIAGPLVDRIGGRNTLVFGLILQLVAFTLFPLIREPWHAYALFALDGVGTACFWPGQSTLLARLTPPDHRHSAYALQRVSMNLGIGLGAAIGGLIATTSDPSSFTRMFLLDAATFLVFATVLLVGVKEPPATEPEEHGEPGSYRAVLRDRNFLALTGLNVLFVAVGYEVFALLPPFAKNYAGVDERWIGFIWLANTLLIVLIQLPVSKALEGRRRMAALALMNVLWAVASLIVLAGGGLLNGTSAALVFMSATMVFARRRDAAGPDAGAARRRPGARASARSLLRAQRDVLERRLDPRPRRRRPAARLAPARGLADRGRRLPVRGARLPAARSGSCRSESAARRGRSP